ncbi:unnamed protein product [Oncorhynchus mykiss]|uniref:Uncharacterized protein n=1 Tax=Oncorhynchus mykiss TaxID=8022 RepID=A0A060XXZ6_ONCMY|nr:unnamed protein product [Oncorhynchus mykiss]
MEPHLLNSEEEEDELEEEEVEKDENNGDDEEDFPDQPHTAPFSSGNEAQGGDSAGWQCTPPSTSASGETPSHPSTQPHSRPSSRPENQIPSQSLSGNKKRSHSNKPAHMRRDIRYDPDLLKTSKLTDIENNI